MKSLAKSHGFANIRPFTGPDQPGEQPYDFLGHMRSARMAMRFLDLAAATDAHTRNGEMIFREADFLGTLVPPPGAARALAPDPANGQVTGPGSFAGLELPCY